MPIGTTTFFSLPENFTEWVKFAGIIVPIIGGLTAIAVTLFTKLIPWWRARRDRTSLQKGLSAGLYLPGVIERSVKYYIEPDCQSIDPAGSEEPRLTMATKEKLFTCMDRELNNDTQYRYFILLADTGMGKSSFLLNYYARHLRRIRRKYEIAVIPLGIPDVEERISDIQDAANTVLFLDALDEDTLAIKDHARRLSDITKLTQRFKKVLITCRTQFFPKDEEIPKETGIVKIGPRAAGEGGSYMFHKLYLSPFSDEQVDKYVKRRYPFWQKTKRRMTRELIRKIPNLVVRPMLLSYLDELLLDNGEEIHYSFELYEKLIEAWLEREEGVFHDIKKETLREFSERLAVNLYLNRESRRAEYIPREELVSIAKEWKIPLDDWKLTGRSLLNRDAGGNFKFAHRSIMEYLFVYKHIRGDASCLTVAWTDQMKLFLTERITFHFNKTGSVPFDITPIKRYRYVPKDDLQDCLEMVQKQGFFDTHKNKKGKGIKHLYETKTVSGQKVIVDYATGLMWQRASSETMLYTNTKDYIAQLNRDAFAGYRDWRLPTLEEAMSLVEPVKNKEGFHIDPLFDQKQYAFAGYRNVKNKEGFHIGPLFYQKQWWIWTSDTYNASSAWVVNFLFGSCGYVDVYYYYDYYVRAVR